MLSLQKGDATVSLCSIEHLQTEHLQQFQKIFWIASTTGEGDAPDSAYAFSKRLMAQNLDLRHLEYAVLALGDRHYQHFCAFGHRLQQWLQQQHAHALFDLIEVDNADAGALRHWQHHLGVLIGHTEIADWTMPGYESWILQERRLLNPGSQGGSAFHLSLVPDQHCVQRTWKAGDIVEVGPEYPPDSTLPENERPVLPHREYSIASITATGSLDLLVRQMRHPDGSLGIGSGWLTEYAKLGAPIALRIRENRSFHAHEEDLPCIYIGNGTGLAGLRAHLQQRASLGQHRNWLIFGERQQAIDFSMKKKFAPGKVLAS